MNIKEVEIVKEMKEFQETYQTIINQIDYSYTGLSKAKDQFPLSFLTKTGIETHITKLFGKNKDRINFANESIKKNRLLLQTEQNLLKKIDVDNIVEYEKISNKIKKIKDTILREQSETQLLRKLELQVSPEKVTYFYEDLLLFVANCKHEALEMWKYSSTVFDDIKTTEEHFAGRFLIDVADDALKDKGYTKIIGDFRIAYLNSRIELKDLRQMMGRAKVVRDASSKLLSALEADEVNFRKFTERMNKLGGI
jgi:hypothetical protein